MKKMNFDGVTVLKKTENSEAKKKGLGTPKSVPPARSSMASVSNSTTSRRSWALYALLFGLGVLIAYIIEQ
ncbi:MAG: hypothetical protein KUL82_10555 [Bdellovibrio sp.]|nr:hypothetical protein [Bdellovibrio sp.]